MLWASNNSLNVWASNIIALAAMHILCIALRYNKPNKSENHNSILFLCLVNKTRTSILFLELIF